MIKLLAVAAQDAYAIIQDERGMYFIRPPFTSRQKSPIPPEALDQALRFHGFRPSERTFSKWAELIQHLCDQAVETRIAAGDPAPDRGRVKRMVERAPMEIVLQYLDRIENELLPSQEFHAGSRILTALLKNPVVQNAPPLIGRCAQLLDACEAEAKQPSPLPSLDQWKSVLPSAGDVAFTLAASVGSRGHMIQAGT
jgi:hypothetical protein